MSKIVQSRWSDCRDTLHSRGLDVLWELLVTENFKPNISIKKYSGTDLCFQKGCKISRLGVILTGNVLIFEGTEIRGLHGPGEFLGEFEVLSNLLEKLLRLKKVRFEQTPSVPLANTSGKPFCCREVQIAWLDQRLVEQVARDGITATNTRDPVAAELFRLNLGHNAIRKLLQRELFFSLLQHKRTREHRVSIIENAMVDLHPLLRAPILPKLHFYTRKRQSNDLLHLIYARTVINSSTKIIPSKKAVVEMNSVDADESSNE